MTTRRWLCLALSCAVPILFGLGQSRASAKEVVTFAYLQLKDDPRYRQHRAYTGLKLRDRRPPIDGARLAIRESRVIGRALGLKFQLVEETLAADQTAPDLIDKLVREQGVRVFLLDLPLDQVKHASAALAERRIMLFNVRHRDGSLRGIACTPVLFHAIPSHAMLMDGLAQYLAKKRWTRVLVLQGETEDDETLAAAFAVSAKKFGLRIVGLARFVLSNDPRRRDHTNVPLLTASDDHDVIFLADSTGEFGRYVPYRTQHPRPVVGTEGLVASPWHWTWERHGAPQLNQRFDKLAKRHMQGEDWAAWAAVRSVVEAIVRAKTTDIAAVRDVLTSDDFTFDTYKGAPGSYRRWNNQLRQPILLHTHNAVVARAPVEGFLHERNNLDTLGADERETACRMTPTAQAQ